MYWLFSNPARVLWSLCDVISTCACSVFKQPAAYVSTTSSSSKKLKPSQSVAAFKACLMRTNLGNPLLPKTKARGEMGLHACKRPNPPTHFTPLWFDDETAKSATLTRDFQSSITNALFEKNDKGLFNVNTGHKMCVEAFEAYQKRFARDEECSMAKTLVMGFYFQKSEQAQGLWTFCVHHPPKPSGIYL